MVALRPTELSVKAGEHLAIIGPSGSGKSALLNLLGLLDRPTEGRLLLDGIDTATLNERDRTALRGHRIGFVFQAFHLMSHRTAVENVMLAQLYTDRRRKAERRFDAMVAEGLTLLVITHDPAVAGQAPRTVTIRDGELTEQFAASVATPRTAVSDAN